MAQGRLAKILESEYKSKGISSGAMSAVGKRSLEIADPRNYLFGGSGLGSIIGRKIFGRGYSASRTNNIVNNNNITGLGPAPSSGLSDQSVDLLRSMKADTAITAKSAVVLPAMSRDMNLVRQNIAKLLLKFGEKPSYKADMFFKRAKEREDMYESQFRKNKGTPTAISTTSKKDSAAGRAPIMLLLIGLASLGKVISDSLKTLGENISNSLQPITDTIKSLAGPPIDAAKAMIKSVNEEDEYKKLKKRRLPKGVAARGGTFTGDAEEEKRFNNLDAKFGPNRYNIPDLEAAGIDSYNNTPSKITPMTTTNESSGLVTSGPEQINALSPERVGNSEDELARTQAEEYLGRAISSMDWEHLKRAVYAESTKNVEEYAHVMAVILNRARKSGKDITAVLMQKNQFQAVTGTKNNPGPSPMFMRGPQGSALGPLLESAGRLRTVSKNLDAFTAANRKAYKEGTSTKWLDKLMSSGGRKIGGTVFAENMYGPRRENNPNTKGALIQDLSARQMNAGSSGPVVNLNKVDNSVKTSTSGSSGKIVEATNRDMLDILFIK
jgi:hypothetical protein